MVTNTDFAAIDGNSTWNVARLPLCAVLFRGLISNARIARRRQTRSDFDKLLLDHVRVSEVQVYERTRVTSLRFVGSDPSRPVAATWRWSGTTDHQRSGQHEGEITFGYVVDASGRAGLMSDRCMKNRHYNESLRNVTLWRYWTGVGAYRRGIPREGAPWFEALTGKCSRAWIVLDDSG